MACLLVSLLAAARGDDALAVSAQGQQFDKALDTFDVEHKWLRGRWLEGWRSGEPLKEYLGKPTTPFPKDETHCSAFAAAVADRFGVYLLRPPEHSHVLLANAQHDWLASDAGKEKGWRAVDGAVAAQQAANGGSLVVAVFKAADPHLPGHIAVLRPTKRSDVSIIDQGPQITQAGWTNYRSTILVRGFDHHPGAWAKGARGAVLFYEHAIDPAVLDKIAKEAK